MKTEPQSEPQMEIAEEAKLYIRVLRGYARDIERYGRPLDSGCPGAL